MHKHSYLHIFLKVILMLLFYECLYYAIAILIPVSSDPRSSNTVSLICQSITAIITIIILGTWYRKEMTTSEPSEQPAPLTGKGWLILIILGVLLSLAGNLLINLTSLPDISQAFKETGGKLVSAPLPLQIVSLVFIIPFCEELIYRGHIFRWLRSVTGFMPTVFISAVIFALMHGNAVQGIYALVTGLFIAAVYGRSRSLAAAFAVHASGNLCAVCIPYLLPEDMPRAVMAGTGLIAAVAAILIFRHFMSNHPDH